MNFHLFKYHHFIGRLVGFVLIDWMFCCQLFAHGVGYHEFSPIDRRLGLDATVVYSVEQDHQGLIWMGTNQGLYSFDGYSAQFHSLDDAQGQNPSGVVYCTMMPDSVHLWLGAESGLLVFNTLTDRFETAPAGLPDNIRAIERIDNHSFWIGSMNGLYRFDISSGRVERVKESALPNQAVYSILKCDATNYYFGTYNGLCHYNAAIDQFENINLGIRQGNANQLILSLLSDETKHVIWIGVEGGLWQYRPSTKEAREIPLFKGNSIKSLLIDNQQCLWAGSDNGLFIYDPVSEQHRLIRHDALNDRSLINNIVWTVFADRDQNIWLGTDGGMSLYAHNSRYQKQSITELTGSTEGNQIISLLADSKGRLWLGGTNGLIVKENGKTVWYQQNSAINPIPHNKVRYIYEDRDGMIWIATDGSICRYDENRRQFVRYLIEDETKVRNANWAYAISEDKDHKLWVATCLGGVFVVDKKQLIASNGMPVIAERNYFSHSGANSLSGNMLQGIQFDVDGNFWASTYRGGLNKIDVVNQKVIQFTQQSSSNAIASDEVSAICVDTEPYIWIAMRNRVVRMNIRDYHQDEIVDSRLNDSYINGIANDGNAIWLSTTAGLFVVDKASLKLKQVNVGTSYFSAVGYSSVYHSIIVGGVNELVTFNPRTVLDDDLQNDLFITALWINDKLVQPNLTQNIVLDRSLRFTHAIELPSTQNNLLFAFSGFRYSDGAGAQYVYQLEGEDVYWRFTDGSANRISYNNLRPGKYTLQIARVGSDGKPMSQPLKLSVTILHPWYSNLLAKIIYSLLFLTLVYAIFNYWVMLHRLRYERLEKVKTMELTTHKIDFLTNISHELKTPLSLIVGPLSRIMEQVKTPALKETLDGVRQNALKMSTLLHQLMEASRQDTDGFGLMVSSADIVLLLRSIASVFEKPLSTRDVYIQWNSNVESLSIVGDVMKLESIFNNILSNASKFAPDHSLITIQIEASVTQVEVTIADEGPGIPPHDLPFVFDRFFQSQHSLKQNKEGSGVGLSIVREYVQLHGGTVNAISDGAHGTTIKVMLPLSHVLKEADDALPVSRRQPVDEKNNEKPVLLIVEDNEEILSFLANALWREFNCYTALNGKLGFEAAVELNPDVIVTDIMMPVMDGLALCRKLKDNVTTANIPVVMLTAKDDKNTELSGYRTGADAFIAKPFEISYLSDRLHLLLQGRHHLVQKARQQAMMQPKEVEAISADEKFLQTITKIIEDEITQEDLNVNWLSEKSGYSAKQVYRRIKALTGQTAVDYIRTVKLKKAALLLSKKTFTVAEVMYMVGFNNHSYFAKRFHEMYGKSPKQFMEEA